MKIVLAIILSAILLTTYGFKIRQGGNPMAGIMTTLNSNADNILEDGETVTNQAIEDTEAYTNCMMACTNPMQFAQCAANCFTTAVQTASQQLSDDTTTFTGQMNDAMGAMAGGAAAGGAAAAPAAPAAADDAGDAAAE